MKDRNKKLINGTINAVKLNLDKIIPISWKDVNSAKNPVVKLSGDSGEVRKEFSPGESLIVHLTGLKPLSAHDFAFSANSKPLFTSTLLSDRKGEIKPTLLWPQMGLDDPNSDLRFTPEEAMEKWQSKTISLNITCRKEKIFRSEFKITHSPLAPIIISSDKNGRLLNGFEVGKQGLFLTVYNLPFIGDARIYLVQRQHDWNYGDRFEPATLRDGSLAIKEVSIHTEKRQQIIEFAKANELLPGAYDFILRPLRYGFEEDELLAVLPNDIIGSRRTTGVVIREGFWTAKPVLGGCVNKIPISGVSVIGAPYFRYRDTFTLGEDVWAGMDPGIVDPGNISKMCALYVIQSKDDLGWANNTLNHLPVLGGNANTTKHKLQAGCMNLNKVLVWPAAMQPGEYDIVADFGNNTPDANLFVQDNQYNTPLDIIDGYFVAGFRIVEDPGTMQNFANVGNWNYTEADFPMFGVNGTISVQDEASAYHISNPPILVNRDVRMKAHVYFPADIPGVVDPAQISAAQPNYPLIVIIHGNGHNYTSYDFLLQHFARNGFIAASIDVRYVSGGVESHGMAGQGRAEALFPHLTVIKTKFGAKAQNNIGIMGHSRGGEAVIKAARINQQQGYPHQINAAASLAPTDRYGTENLSGAWSKPYFVLYGSRDGDVKGGPPTTPGYTVAQCGFSLYDRASGNKKSMCFLYKATHNGFITVNSDALPTEEDDVLDPDIQKAYTKAYMNAFFRWHLKNEPKWEDMFKGEWQPASVSSTGAKSYQQYRDTTLKVIDDFEGPLNWQQSSIGSNVTHNMTLPVDPVEEKMSAAVMPNGLDPKCPHDTQGMKIRWDNLGDKLEFAIPPAHQDVSAYSVISFRITQKVESNENLADQPQNLRVILKDAANNERAVRVSPFYEIPYPDMRPEAMYRKSAMNTVRVPLKSYTIVCAGQAQIDLQHITTLSFLFSEVNTGEIEIDEIEFSN